MIRNESGTNFFLSQGVSEGYFQLLTVRPHLGRFFTREDSSESLLVISYSVWKSRLHPTPESSAGAFPSYDREAVIIGVAPKRFTGTERIITADIWYPLESGKSWTDINRRDQAEIDLQGRLAPGVTLDQCRAEMQALSPLLRVSQQLAAAQNPRREMTLMVASSLQSGQTAAAIRQTIRTVDPGAVIILTTTLRDNIRLALLPNQIAAELIGSFGGLALILASIGLYGVVSFTIKQRTNEIGIRLALGPSLARFCS